MTSNKVALVLAAMTDRRLASIVARLLAEPRRGRPWWRDLRIVTTTAGGPGNRNDPVHDRGSEVEHLCREHGRVLADGGYRGIGELVTPVFRRNRIVRDRAWRRPRRRRAQVEHAIARLKNWRILRDHRRRGCHLADGQCSGLPPQPSTE